MRRDDVQIDNPCEVSWENMQGAGRQRHCSQCAEDVVNLSMMTEAQAEAFLEANHSPCIRYHLSAEGDILFQTRLQRQRRGAETLLRTAAVLVPLVVGSAAGAAAAVHSTETDPAAQYSQSADGSTADAPDLVEVVDDDESLADAVDAADETADAHARSAADTVLDVSAYVAESVETDDADPAPPPDDSPADDAPTVMGEWVGSK